MKDTLRTQHWRRGEGEYVLYNRHFSKIPLVLTVVFQLIMTAVVAIMHVIAFDLLSYSCDWTVNANVLSIGPYSGEFIFRGVYYKKDICTLDLGGFFWRGACLYSEIFYCVWH